MTGFLSTADNPVIHRLPSCGEQRDPSRKGKGQKGRRCSDTAWTAWLLALHTLQCQFSSFRGKLGGQNRTTGATWGSEEPGMVF